MNYDYSKLEGRIVEKCGTRKKFGEKLNVSERTLSLKLNNKLSWKQSEINKAIDILEIPENEIHMYFFTQKVQ